MIEKTPFCEIANLLPDAVVVADADGKITWSNGAFHRLCGHSRSFVKGRKPGSFLQGPDTDAATVEKVRQGIARGEPVEAELLNYHESGKPYWVSLRITPIRNKAKKLTGFIAIEREFTAFRRRECELQDEVGTLYATLLSCLGRIEHDGAASAAPAAPER